MKAGSPKTMAAPCLTGRRAARRSTTGSLGAGLGMTAPCRIPPRLDAVAYSCHPEPVQILDGVRDLLLPFSYRFALRCL